MTLHSGNAEQGTSIFSTDSSVVPLLLLLPCSSFARQEAIAAGARRSRCVRLLRAHTDPLARQLLCLALPPPTAVSHLLLLRRLASHCFRRDSCSHWPSIRMFRTILLSMTAVPTSRLSKHARDWKQMRTRCTQIALVRMCDQSLQMTRIRSRMKI